AENGELLSEYTSAFAEINRIRKEIRELSMSEREKARKTEQLKFEIADIDEAKLSPDEESSLEERRNLVKNIEKTIKSTRLATRALYRSEKGMPAYELVKRASAAIESISDCIPESDAIISRLNEILFELEDIGNTLESYTKVDFDDPTAELDRIETRLDEIGRLKRKYGSDIAEILEFRKKAAAELDDIEISDVKIKELTYELKAAGDKARKIAESLSAKRRSAAAELSSAITEELKYLEMPKVRFCVEVKVLRDDKGASQLGPNGGDEVEFMFSANPGEPLKPLSKIASGGELSRVMLALKTAGHDRSGSETMIFDEIDSGVSGKTAQKIGMRLRGISEGTQVICVTHSAQVASSASWQYLIEKRENDGRSETNLKLLSKDERVYEIARIMGGVEITEKLLDTARELLETSEIYENKQLSKNTGD
ncbi:MAG: DNA repair protein RecN, partial [Firmicutes bacterium]|nr:DNA repair protein RecN [Bacillota bacterium]